MAQYQEYKWKQDYKTTKFRSKTARTAIRVQNEYGNVYFGTSKRGTGKRTFQEVATVLNTSMIPPPGPGSENRKCLGRPKALASQSITTISTSVQAGLEA